MTNRQSKTTAEVPTWRQIAGPGLIGLGLLVVTFWMLGGHTTREGIGSIAVGCWAGWNLGQFVDRFQARRAARQAVAEERKRHTGTWTAPEGEGRFSVRYDPDSGHYLVCGWFSEAEHYGEESQVAEDTLRIILIAQERDGFTPADDEGTRVIRARLDLPGWDGDEHPLVAEIREGTHPLGGPMGELWDEPARDLTRYRDRFKPGPY